MKRYLLAVILSNFLLLYVLGTLLTYPNIKSSKIAPNIEDQYSSVCMLTTGNSAASGVLLESGYIITAGHVVDTDGDWKLGPDERVIEAYFPVLELAFKAEVLVISTEDLDLAILWPESRVPLRGSRLIDPYEYGELRVGTQLTTIGMMQGAIPANITDGRLVEIDASALHKNSANSYYGSSGGGVFVENRLIGISSAVGYDELNMEIPIIEHGLPMGSASVLYRVPMANMSLHVSAPAIADFILENQMDEVLTQVSVCPIREYFPMLLFTALMLTWLSAVCWILYKVNIL